MDLDFGPSRRPGGGRSAEVRLHQKTNLATLLKAAKGRPHRNQRKSGFQFSQERVCGEAGFEKETFSDTEGVIT